jgi:16S rRNA G1207 methylase RsmC
LEQGGSFFVVVQKKHGAQSQKQKLTEIFGEQNCRVLHSKKGCFVFEFAKNI